MSITFKRIIFSLFFNSSLLLILIIGIQNSSKKSRVHFFQSKTVNLPISFIVGGSFISGSLTAGFLSIYKIDKKKLS